MEPMEAVFVLLVARIRQYGHWEYKCESDGGGIRASAADVVDNIITEIPP